MSHASSVDVQQRVLRYWWMLELFSPQQVPKPTPRATRPAHRQVIEWGPADPLPWEALRPPAPIGKTRRVWQHTVFFGVYDLEATYTHLHRAFGVDRDAYDERPAGRSACAGILIDGQGRLIADSGVLSSALWAVAQLTDRGAQDPTWADGFPVAAAAFVEAVDKHEGTRREEGDEDLPPVQDAPSLLAVLRIAQNASGIAETPSFAADGIVIQSVAVSAQRGEDAGDTDFLNSFFLDDLAAVRADVTSSRGCGEALAAYLTGDGALEQQHRVDVMVADETVTDMVGVGRLPKGRWLSDPAHVLSLRQQFAVNQALTDLASTNGLMGVNGPPGTGKTTMLRDILAGNVVERARRLAALARPEDAFTATTHRWTAKDGHPRKVRALRPELTGFEMVVASANNVAVENVTTEIPGQEAIDARWRDVADYFPDIATAILDSDRGDSSEGEDDEGAQDGARSLGAWGLVAARLGNKRNRSAFHTEFWFDKKDPKTNQPVPGSVPRMQTCLAQWRDDTAAHTPWPDARVAFAQAERAVDALIAKRRDMQERNQRVPQAVADEVQQRAAARLARAHVAQATEDLQSGRATAERTEQAWAEASRARQWHIDIRPGILETVFTLGRAVRAWRTALHPFDERLHEADRARAGAQAAALDLEHRLTGAHRALTAAEDALAITTSTLERLRRQTIADKDALGPAYPGEAWTGDERELRTPWLNAELDEARSNLFLAALHLHRDFLACMAGELSHGLRAALDVVAGSGPHGLEPAKKLAAWQLFFLVVPLVSTTFASFGRMFGDIGRDSIGWLLIDEAGQASPQYAAGAIWRAKRVVAVGDPLQLQPVVTIPQKAQRDIATAYGVSDTWIPPRASVQTLADRVTAHGTTLQHGDEPVWVSAPLTVHRRCDDPMFSLCNTIAYNNIMVNGVTRNHDDPARPDLFDSPTGPRIAASHWVDEPALTPGTHLQENQIARLERALAYLRAGGVSMDDVIAISPFRAVADRLKTLAKSYDGLQAGTIHTAQGREASVVFLILGGDPASPGAKVWAASSVNLVNVAASRAKRRLYVIGDHDAWAAHNYFRQLAASLAPTSQGTSHGP
ncbi:AAA domain-containing protein [Plantibacter sp. YIM 135249]|uniref:DEAD/DEAH box helicase n=1 Tax=Plantibacter sp. YIM 135249 TaxID=3423918 RepID=UPI003D3277C3